jgi:hypothetical protein
MGNTLPKARIICSLIVNIQSFYPCSAEQCVPSDYFIHSKGLAAGNNSNN